MSQSTLAFVPFLLYSRVLFCGFCSSDEGLGDSMAYWNIVVLRQVSDVCLAVVSAEESSCHSLYFYTPHAHHASRFYIP